MRVEADFTKALEEFRIKVREDRRRYANAGALARLTFLPILVYRMGSTLRRTALGSSFCGKAVSNVLAAVNILIFDVELDFDATIGGGLRLYHGRGIVVQAGAVLGDYVTLLQGVTIGRAKPADSAPRIGNRVSVGAYAQVLGGIEVSDRATVGAMAVVLSDVGSGCTVVGNPARIVRSGGIGSDG